MSALTYIDGFLDPLAECLDDASALRLLNLKIDPQAEARLEVLAAGANEGTLTGEEMNEYGSLIDAADFVEILKMKVARRLQTTSTGD